MENIIITNRDAYLAEEKVRNKNVYECISENNASQGPNLLPLIQSEKDLDQLDSKSIAENKIHNKLYCEKSEILSLGSDSKKDILTTNENYDENINGDEKSNKKINPKTLIKAYIGHVSEAHHYILDNEFIMKGYRINFHSCKRISRSLCMCHNETINVWTHFIGAILTILFMFLVIFNVGPINSESSLKSYFERKSRGNYTKNILNKSAYQFKNGNDTEVNWTNRIQLDFGNYLINDVNNNNYNYNLKYNNSIDDLVDNKTENNKKWRNNNAVEFFFRSFSEKLKLKFINDFESDSLVDFDVNGDLSKKEVREKDKKFINDYYDDAMNKNKNGELEDRNHDNSWKSKLEIDVGLFERIKKFVDIESLQNYLLKNIIDNNLSVNLKNKTRVNLDEFNNIFISSINKIIEKYNDLIDLISDKNANLADNIVFENLKDFLQKVINMFKIIQKIF